MRSATIGTLLVLGAEMSDTTHKALGCLALILAVVFAGHAIASRIRHAATEQRVVELARELALMQAAPPPEASR